MTRWNYIKTPSDREGRYSSEAPRGSHREKKSFHAPCWLKREGEEWGGDEVVCEREKEREREK